MEKKIALVTGANRGIGFEACRQLARFGFKVILSARDQSYGESARAKLKRENFDVLFRKLDVTEKQNISDLYSIVKSDFGKLDVLVNNAGVLVDRDDETAMIETFAANSLGPYYLCKKFLPLMKKNNYGRIINISSGLAQLLDIQDGYEAYRLSKVALSAVTRIYAAREEGTIFRSTPCAPAG